MSKEITFKYSTICKVKMLGTICSIGGCNSNALKAAKEGKQIDFINFLIIYTHIRNLCLEKCQRKQEFSIEYQINNK